MKKKLLTILLLATISILCAVLFAACNNGNNTQKDTYSIALSHDDTETPLVKINTTGNYDWNAIEKGSSITFSVELRNDYDPSTLKIFSNDKETALQLNADLSNDYIDNVTYNQIGTFTLDNITENINLTYQVAEQKIAIHFYTSIFEGTPTTEQTEVLNSFYIDGDTKPLSEYVDSEQPFYTTLSRILSTETRNGSAKYEGYLSVCGGEILNGAYIYDTFSFGEGMMKALLYKEGEPGNLFQDWATPEKNLFFINLQDYFVWRDPQTANQAYAKKMNIAVDPTAILPNPYGRIQPSGTVFDVDESLLYKDFSLGKNPENVSFTLNKLDGVNFENAEVRIWDSVIEPDENGVYTIDQAPIYYKSTEKIQNELSITAYRIFLSGVDYSACEDLFVLTIDNQHKEQAAVYNRSGGYYSDENIIVTDKDTLYSTHVEFEISYDIATSEKITELSAASIDFILTVTLKDQKVLTFDLGEYLPSSGNITFDPGTQSNSCDITETDQVEIRYNLSETGTLSDENGVSQYIYRFDIRVGCWIGTGINSVKISQK